MMASHKPHLMQLHNDSVENLAHLDTLEPHQHLAVIDRACPSSERLLTEARYRIYHKIRWVLLDSTDDDLAAAESKETDMLRLVSALEVTGSCNLFYFAWTKEGELVAKDVYRISINSELITSVVAIWRNGAFEDQQIGKSVAVRRKNLQLTPIRTTLIYTSNYTLSHFDDYESPQIDTITRNSYHIAKVLYDFYLNATMKKKYATSWCYSNIEGMCSDIIGNRTDFGAALLFMTQPRLKALSYTKVPIRTFVRIIYKTPNLSTTDNIFELPFDAMVWNCTAGLTILAGGLTLAAYLFNREMDGDQTPLSDAAFNIIPVACQQGSNIEAYGISRKAFILVSLIGLMFLEASYSAKIISLIQAPSERISTLKDLLESKLEVATADTPYNRHYLSTSTEPVRRALYEKKLLLKNGSMNIYSVNDGIAKIREGLFAYHVYTSTAYQRVSETYDEVEKCYLRELVFFTNSIGYLPMKMNYTFREHMNVGMMRILETGIFIREHNRMHFSKPSCDRAVSFRPLNVVDIWFSIELMGWGLGSAILLLSGEIVWRKHKISRIPIFPYVE
ncbi:uncharacterized protein LOC134210156 [Armigeres subalbatus]|uniref:uncharacterized protein LOC134210156 n=1 Tax=Armigeres subalbatus TaxID=124917 RepID=UPI002ED4027C